MLSKCIPHILYGIIKRLLLTDSVSKIVCVCFRFALRLVGKVRATFSAPKPIAPFLRLGPMHAFASNSDCFIVLFTSVIACVEGARKGKGEGKSGTRASRGEKEKKAPFPFPCV